MRFLILALLAPVVAAAIGSCAALKIPPGAGSSAGGADGSFVPGAMGATPPDVSVAVTPDPLVIGQPFTVSGTADPGVFLPIATVSVQLVDHLTMSSLTIPIATVSVATGRFEFDGILQARYASGSRVIDMTGVSDGTSTGSFQILVSAGWAGGGGGEDAGPGTTLVVSPSASASPAAGS